MKRLRACCGSFSVCFVLLLSACQDAQDSAVSPAESPAPEAANLTHRISRPTEYYVAGPQQARPPDGQFSAGVKVRVLEDAGSYTRIRTENGLEAYVATGALEMVPPGSP